jgi:hypothetical protein
MAGNLAMAGDDAGVAAPWDQRYREGGDGWELGRPAPPLEQALRHDPRMPQPPARVLAPGCGLARRAVTSGGGELADRLLAWLVQRPSSGTEDPRAPERGSGGRPDRDRGRTATH